MGVRGALTEASPTQSIAVSKMWSEGLLVSSDIRDSDHTEESGAAHSSWAPASAEAVSGGGSVGTFDELLGAGWDDGGYAFESDLRL